MPQRHDYAHCHPLDGSVSFLCHDVTTGSPPSKVAFVGTALRHGDVLHATARWCNQAELCTSLSSRTTLVDTVPPTVSGFYGAQSSVESQGAGPMQYQSLDNAYFTVTLAYDLDSGVDTLEAGVELVGLATNGLAVQACNDGSGIPGTVLVYDWTFLPSPMDPTSASNLSIEFALAASLRHNTMYRVLLRATDMGGNTAVSRTSCVLVDHTPPTVVPHTFSEDQTVELDGTLFYRDDSVAERNLLVGATVTNDVSGVAAASLCCGSSPGLCDVPLEADVVTSPAIPSAHSVPSVNVTSAVRLSASLDGAQVRCTHTVCFLMRVWLVGDSSTKLQSLPLKFQITHLIMHETIEGCERL